MIIPRTPCPPIDAESRPARIGKRECLALRLLDRLHEFGVETVLRWIRLKEMRGLRISAELRDSVYGENDDSWKLESISVFRIKRGGEYRIVKRAYFDHSSGIVLQIGIARARRSLAAGDLEL